MLLRTFLIGIAVAAPVGAMGVLCIQRTLAGGWRAGLATGAGIATADGLYAAAAAFGVSSVSTLITAAQTPLRLVGGALLVYLGIKAAMTPPPDGVAAAAADGRPASGRAYVTAVGLTLTNPMTIMAFAAVFASAGLAVSGGVASSLMATAGVTLGSFAWWLALVTAVSVTRHALSPRIVRGVSIVSGAGVAVFGVLAVVQAFSTTL